MHAQYPGKLLAYNCSPSFNWKAKLDEATIAKFQRELGAMGYKFQFVTLAGFHSLNHGMFELASGYRDRGMAAYSELQQAEFASARRSATPPPATSARSAPAISTPSPPPSRPARPRPWRSANRPKPRNSRTLEQGRETHGTALLGHRRRISRLPLRRGRAGHRGNLAARSPTCTGRAPNGRA